MATPAKQPLLELTVISDGDGERSDAARNRARILDAANRLFAEHGPQNVSMDDVARAAGVGKGTLFRRFGDRAGLARSVLSTNEAAFQETLIRGAPPLGPGALPVERLVAFGRGMLGFVDANCELLIAAETGSPRARFLSGPYASYRFFVRSLIAEGAPQLNPDYTADAILAVLGGEFVGYLRMEREMSIEDVADGFEDYVRALIGGSPKA